MVIFTTCIKLQTNPNNYVTSDGGSIDYEPTSKPCLTNSTRHSINNKAGSWNKWDNAHVGVNLIKNKNVESKDYAK